MTEPTTRARIVITPVQMEVTVPILTTDVRAFTQLVSQLRRRGVVIGDDEDLVTVVCQVIDELNEAVRAWSNGQAGLNMKESLDGMVVEEDPRQCPACGEDWHQRLDGTNPDFVYDTYPEGGYCEHGWHGPVSSSLPAIPGTVGGPDEVCPSPGNEGSRALPDGVVPGFRGDDDRPSE